MDFNYIEQANVTMSENFHEGVPALLVASGLMEISGSIDSLDKVKKYMFYGREDQGLSMACAMGKQLHPNDSHDVDFEALVPGKSREEAIRIFHGIIGIITEAGELARALGEALAENKALDLVNVKEEIGDGFWYDAAILRVMGITFEDVQKVNIAKLRARFPNKFDAHDANNRNLERERGILEGGKPVVQIKNWSIVGNRLLGTALNHPKAPNGGESDVRTTRILSQEGNRVETLNTIYELIGDGADLNAG